jgi:hypothetical protein
VDFTSSFAHGPLISSGGIECGAQWTTMGPRTQSAPAAFPAANQALFFPLTITTPYLVTKCWWQNGATGGGNVDIGVYTLGGARLFALGSTAQGTTSSAASASIATPYLLVPGTYYMAFACNSGTATFLRYAPGVQFCKAMGYCEQATAFALPATATFATSTSNYRPTFGIGNASVI